MPKCTAEAAADDEARELVERELGRCLKRGDIEDEIAGHWDALGGRNSSVVL